MITGAVEPAMGIAVVSEDQSCTTTPVTSTMDVPLLVSSTLYLIALVVYKCNLHILNDNFNM